MPFRHYNLLLAEDDPDDQLLFSHALEELAISQPPVIVADGQALVDYLQQTSRLPDLIFLDINMPFKDGLTALQEIKALPALAHLPVVILSTASNDNMVNRAYALGACLYARKPNGFRELTELIRNILSLDVTGLLAKTERDQFLVNR